MCYIFLPTHRGQSYRQSCSILILPPCSHCQWPTVRSCTCTYMYIVHVKPTACVVCVMSRYTCIYENQTGASNTFTIIEGRFGNVNTKLKHTQSISIDLLRVQIDNTINKVAYRYSYTTRYSIHV